MGIQNPKKKKKEKYTNMLRKYTNLFHRFHATSVKKMNVSSYVLGVRS